MASSLVLSKQIFPVGFYRANKLLPRLLSFNRSLCSKNDDPSNKSAEVSDKKDKNVLEKGKEISEQNAKETETSKEAAKKKISDLVSEIPEDAQVRTASKLDLAKPIKRISKKERLEIMKANQITPQKEMDKAVKEVASTFNDPEKVESEISEKLSTINFPEEVEKELEVDNESKLEDNLSERLISSVEEVAETISENPIPPREKLTEKLLKSSKEKPPLSSRQTPMYADYRSKFRFGGRRGAQMSVMAQIRLEAELEAAKKDFEENRRSPPKKYYKDDPVPRQHSRRNAEMSVIEQMRQEARMAESAKKESYVEPQKPIAKQYEESFTPKQRDVESRKMSVIEQMRQEARMAASAKKESYVEPQKPIPKQYGESFTPKQGDDESGEMSVIGQLRKEAQLAALKGRDSYMMKPQKPIITKVDLFGSTPLNIFSLDSETKKESRNELWQKLQEKQLRLLSQFAPANGFEEMILWTEQGKHWKFPIDNQAEMGAEENIGFHEHVFLERHLEGFPTKGPIRHFMELVVVGLSKNHYITVQRKIDNIEWFRNYFKEKENILKETGAIE